MKDLPGEWKDHQLTVGCQSFINASQLILNSSHLNAKITWTHVLNEKVQASPRDA